LRNPAPVHSWFIPLFIGRKPSEVVQDFVTIHSFVAYSHIPHHLRPYFSNIFVVKKLSCGEKETPLT
jgi:hypothetical protein